MKLSSGETIDKDTGEVVEDVPEPLPEGTCSRCGAVGTTTSLRLPGRRPTPPLCAHCLNELADVRTGKTE